MFGKAMSIPDGPMREYYELLLDREPPEAPPVEQKRELARSLVRLFYGEEAADDAEEHFYTLARRGVPKDAREVELPLSDEIWIVDLITRAGFAKTNGEARRFLRGGAVRLDGKVIADETLSLPEEELDGKILRVGKRRYARLVAPR
jgi:tyrosyl-tRNA synthetase